ncbi:MAG: patatin-like phospholipase family protein, partial [Bacteroidota bacterium]
MNKQKEYAILSLDGGGIRGIIQSIVLAKVEEMAKQPICELFDVIAGTSTGGLLALALTMRDEDGKPVFKARQLTELYEGEKGQRIF